MQLQITSLAALCALSSVASAQSFHDVSRYIWNQNSLDQCPGRFRICHDLEDQEIQGSMVFTQLNDSTSVVGLRARGEEMTNKGSMTAVQGLGDMDSFAGQAGSASGSLGTVRGFFSSGFVRGVRGSAIAEALTNFSSNETSDALGGEFVGGAATSSPPLILDGVGDYFVGGLRGIVSGQVDGDPGNGAVAGVIGVDSADPSSTAPHYAGYFLGDVCVSDDVVATGGSIFLDSETNPGRSIEITSGGRQEIHNTNDLVFYSGGNINLRPGVTSSTNNAFSVTDSSGSNHIISASPQDGYMVIGGTSPSGSHILTVNGSACATGGFTTCSSQRFKEDVVQLDQASDLVRSLRGVRYTSKSTGEREIGLIAEEVAEVLPEIVAFEEDGQALGLDYSRLTAILVEGMKEQQEELEQQATRFGEQQELLSELLAEVEDLRSQLHSQK